MTLKVSVADRMAAAGGRPSGFDYMRLILAVAVVVSHSFSTANGNDQIWDSPARAFFRSILPMFFALSGFLVAGSMERSRTLVKFLGLRVIRIYPALAVEVLISAILLGPLVTRYSPSEYFTDPLFYRYLVKVTGHISYYLPGVFADNPKPNVVNGQLWTVPFELLCYMSLAGLILFGAKKRRAIVPVGAITIFAAWVLLSAYRHNWQFFEFYRALGGPHLIASFLFGVAAYLYREIIPHSAPVFVASVLAGLVLLGLIPHGSYFAVPLIAYATVYLGVCNPDRASWLKGADYSYGIFLYGYVIQQSVMHFAPGLRTWYWNVLVCVPLSAIVSAASWYWVEKPAMNLRKVVDWVEIRYLALMGRLGFLSKA